jgi:hypothetical protein
MKLSTALCLSLLAVATAPLASAAKPVPPPTSIDVTSRMWDQDTSVPSNQYLFRSDLWGGLNQTTYTTTGGVTSTVGINGPGWSLRLFNQSVRKVWIQLNPVSGSPAASSGLYSDKVEIYSWCFDDAGTRISFLSIPAGTSNNRCILGFDFGGPEGKFKMALGQFASPANGRVTVTCHAGPVNACNSWTIAPNTIDPLPNIANLYKFDRRGSLVYVGQYYLTFRIDVTNP